MSKKSSGPHFGKSGHLSGISDEQSLGSSLSKFDPTKLSHTIVRGAELCLDDPKSNHRG